MSTGVWNPSDIPSQNGKSIIITGSTSGIGLETAKELARAGGNITLAARNPEKAKAVIQELEKETGNKNIEFMPVDTSSPAGLETLGRWHGKREGKRWMY